MKFTVDKTKFKAFMNRFVTEGSRGRNISSTYHMDFAYFEVWNTIIQQVIEVIIDLLEISSIEDLGYEERLRVINQLATGLNSVMFDNHFRFDLPLSKEV